ncbi:Mitogen-activated protein kinase kinase kinase 20, partial [Linum grandiflorum]
KTHKLLLPSSSSVSLPKFESRNNRNNRSTATMDWIRGDSLGYGSTSTVNLAFSRGSSTHCCGSSILPAVMAVKSSPSSDLLENERDILSQLGDSPQIIRCFGIEKENLFLEYASKGSLADRVRQSPGGRLPELEARRYTGSVLRGLSHIHGKGFVHCDIKLQNLLIFDGGEVKIADFGLATRTGEDRKQRKFQIRGTPLFMAPESVADNEYSPACDVWALGCAVVEMLTGKPARKFDQGMDVFSFLVRIGAGDESFSSPAIPEELSGEAKDFLSKCFVKDSDQRWTAEMLLDHPFIAGQQNCVVSEESDSPRCPFDFPEWVSVQLGSDSHSSPFDSLASTTECSTVTSEDRIRELAGDRPAVGWEDSGSWLVGG